jgi:uncharacterized FlgJ-related protein
MMMSPISRLTAVSGNSKDIMGLKNSQQQRMYISKCLAVLYKFIQKRHKNKNVVFWPDLASAHYAKDTLVRLEELKIEYVPKKENLPNVPQIRPIENI